MTKSKGSKGNLDDMFNRIDTQGESLYKYWLDNHAKPHIIEWLDNHGYDVDTCGTYEYVEFITKHFIDWIAKN